MLTVARDEFELQHDPRKHNVAAHCCNPTHGLACRRARTCNPSDRRPRQGRPIGELVAWALQAGAHPNRERHLNAELPLEERVIGRAFFNAARGAEAMLAFEHPQRAGEPEEAL